MSAQRYALVGLAAITLAVAGCEGIDRKHDPAVADVTPPADPFALAETEAHEPANFPDLVERMLTARMAYLESIRQLEREYLLTGDTVRSNWARRQRDVAANSDVYPYLTAEAPEQRVSVSPEMSIPEADAVYGEALAMLNTVRGVPLKGVLESSKQRARQALNLFKKVLRDYPRSDKVDDCAFFCGEIYKEYLREDDPDDELAIRYYRWAYALNPQTPHAARFQCAVVLDFRRHDRTGALELYHKVLEQETHNASNVRFAATRIEQLTDEESSHIRPYDKPPPSEPGEISEAERTAPSRAIADNPSGGR